MTSRGRYQTGSGRLNKGRTSQMRTTMAHLCTFFILLFMFFAASAQKAMAEETKTKLSPTIKFGGESSYSVDATVGTVNFGRPTLTITDPDGKSISRYFSLTWSFKNGTDSTDASGRVYSVDPTTGSVISKLYDGVTIGRRTGTATVVLTLSIAPRYKDTYELATGATTTASYTINVKSPEVTAEYYNGSTKLTKESTLQIYNYKNTWGGDQHTSVPVPTAKLYYSLDNYNNDVTSCYDYKYDLTDGFSIDNNTITASKVGDGKLTITATPKKEYQAMLGSTPITTTVKLNCTVHDGKIKTYISFAKHELDTYKYRNNQEQYKINSPDVIVKDEYGNDITSLVTTWNVDWQNTAQNVFQKFSKDPHDSINETDIQYGALTNTNTSTLGIGTITDGSNKLHGSIQFGRPDDYIITVNVNLNNPDLYEKPVADPNFTSLTVNGQFYNANGDAPYSKDNTYTVASNQLLLRVHKRVPTIKLSPDPSTVELAEGYTMTAFNRFNIIGEIKDPYTSDPTDSASNFHYKFFLPDNMNYRSDKKDSKNVTLEVTTNAPSKTCHEWVPAYHNGVIEKNDDGTTKMELVHGTYYESWKDYKNEDFKMVFHLPEGVQSADNVPIIYTIVPWTPQQMDVGISGYYNFKVVKKEPTHFVIDPKKQVNSVGQTIPCPSIKVADQFGVDVTDQFDVKKSQSATSDKWKLNDDGSVTSTNPGTYTVNVNGTRNSTSTKPFENPSQDTYEMIFKQGSEGSTGAYEVIYDKDHNEKMGKLHFIKAGDFFPGTTVYHEVPGINITFGSAKDTEDGNINVWKLIPSPITDATYFSDDKLQGADNDKDWADKTNKKLQKITVTANATTFGNDNLPTGGGFLKIEAVTNGWLYIDGNFQYDTDKKTGRHYIIVDASSKEQQTIGYIKDKDHPAADNVAEVKFPKPLLAGHTYYIYSDDGGMRIHGLRFEPGFIDPVTDALPWAHPGAVDTEPVAASTAFLNGYTGNLPALTFHQPDPTVRWYCDDVKASNTNTNPTTSDIVQCKDKEGKHVNISNTNGIVLGKAMTNEAPLNDKSREGYANGRVRVYGEVKGVKHSNGDQVMKTPEYYLFVGDMPTYIVQEGEKHDQDERISTTNIPTRIWMTFGGWHWSSNTAYPYYKGNDPKNTWLDDEWKTAKMDSVGHNEQTVDGFNFITWGAQNPSDELVRGWDKGNRNTFNLPVRGTYLKFEPEESGRLLLYVCMNGMTDITSGDTDAKKKKNGPWLRRRALYIVDETGKPVAIDDNSGWESKYTWGNYVNSGKTNSVRFNGYTNYYQNYYCDGVTRAAWEYKVGDTNTNLGIWDETDKTDKDGKKYSWMNAYDRNHDGTLDAAEQKNLDADYKKIHDWWTASSYTYKKTSDGTTINMNYEHSKLDGPLELIQLSDSSYVLPTKGYVRFTFQVYAGKVYYVFMTGSKLGFCGFGFIPSSYRANIDQWTKYSSDQKNADGTAFTDATYNKLPQPDATTDNLYLDGKSGNARLMGGAKTLDVALTADLDGSYAKWKENGFLLSEESNNSSGTKNTARDFVNVTLKRTFLNKRWAGICLPFTVSETQMKKIFGENMQLVTVDSVMASEGHDRMLHLTQHSNQLLEAGRPYLIYPNVSKTDDGAAIGDGSVTFKGVTVESVKPMTVIMKNEEVVKHNKDVAKQPEKGQKVEIFTYQISGQYDKAIIPWYSYYMKNSTDKDKNKFYRIIKPSRSTAKGRNLPGCNIWLYPYSYDAEGDNKLNTDDGSASAKLADFWITGAEVAGNTATGIDEIVDDLNAATTTAFPGVYDLQGRQVRSTNNLQGLTPGIYLMGGRKYVVR